mgnify:CR=1 FL=1
MTLSKIFIFLFLIVFSYQNSLSDREVCSQANKNECKSTRMTDSNIECCKSTNLDINTFKSEEVCTAFHKNEIADELIELAPKQYREIMGFVLTLFKASYSYDEPSKVTIDCNSKTFTVNYKLGEVTSEEKEILNNNNHCLKLYYEGLIDLNPDMSSFLDKRVITKEDCSNAVFLPSTKDSVTCAYASFDFELEDETTKHYTSCLYIAKYSFNNKALDQFLIDTFSEYKTINETAIKSFKIEISDKSGKSIIYDSETLSFNPESSTASSSNKSKGELIGMSKFLSLILIISLL